MLKRCHIDCKYIFIAPPSIDELEKRLRIRGTDSEADIQSKLKQAVGDLGTGATPGAFNAILTNDDVEFTVGEFLFSLQNWYPDLDFDAIYLQQGAGSEPAAAETATKK